MIRIAKIEIDKALLLQILDFKGGTLHDVTFKPDSGVITLIVGHPDIPGTDESKPVATITPVMGIEYGDNGMPLRIERIYPPKTVKPGVEWVDKPP